MMFMKIIGFHCDNDAKNIYIYIYIYKYVDIKAYILNLTSSCIQTEFAAGL
jgi:hypothetical protein